jgi:hypothetical protein
MENQNIDPNSISPQYDLGEAQQEAPVRKKGPVGYTEESSLAASAPMQKQTGNPDAPQLRSPQEDSSSSPASGIQGKAQEADALLNMLDSWLKSIEQIGDMKKSKNKKVQTAEKALQKTESIVHLLSDISGAVSGKKIELEDQAKPAAPIASLVGGFVLALSGTGIINQSKDSISSEVNATFNVASEAYNALKGFLPESVQSEVSLVVGYFTSVAMYLNPIIGSIVGNGENISPEDLKNRVAAGYTQEVSRLMKDPEASSMMEKLITKADEAVEGSPNPKRIKELLALAKLIILITALAINIQRPKGLTIEKIKEIILDGKIDNIDPDQLDILKEIEKDLHELSDDLAGKVLEIILKYLEEAKAAGSSKNPIEILQDVLNQAKVNPIGIQNI